jgi:hypothetical protein
VEELFGTVLVVIVVVAVIVAALSYWGSGDMYDHIGRSGLSLDEPDLRPDPLPGTAAYDADAAAEIRQMLEAKSARLERRGEPPLDIEAELAALTAPKHEIDAGLRAEIRDLVVARNERRVRRGEEPVDVDAEVESEIERLGGGG